MGKEPLAGQEPTEDSDQTWLEQIARADPTFKNVTSQAARARGINIVGAELPQTVTADLIFELNEDTDLTDSLFSFLSGYRFAVVDFKGPNDPLDMPKLLLNVARTALFCAKNPQVSVRQVLNLLVCSRYPANILKEPAAQNIVGFHQPDPEKQPWLWLGRYVFQEIIIVVCRDLPIEERFFDWLLFMPADIKKWPVTVRQFLAAGRYDLVALSRNLHPKEFNEMKLEITLSDITANMTQRERKQYYKDLAALLRTELNELLVESPEDAREMISKVEPQQLADVLTDEQFEKLVQLRKLKKQAESEKNPIAEE